MTGEVKAVVKPVTGTDSPLTDVFGHAPRHPLTDCSYSQAALFYGDDVARIVAAPVAPGRGRLSREPSALDEIPDRLGGGR